MRKPKNSGFTLMELLIVMAIILILTSITVAAVQKFMLKAKLIKCDSNLKSLYVAMQTYVADHNHGAYPPETGSAFWEVLRKYPTPDTAVLKSPLDDVYFICPVVGGQGQPGVSHYRGPKEQLNIATDSHRPIAADLPENHGDHPIKVLLMDGRRIDVKPNDQLWTEVEKRTGK